MRWLKDGDTNSKLFHAVANGRRAKNFITHIKQGSNIVTEQSEKEEVFFQAYSDILGSIQNRDVGLDLEEIGLANHSGLLEDLGEVFTEAEVWVVIKELPSDRAPGPDGFVGDFYKRAWPIIKSEVMAGLLKLYVGDGRGFQKLNRALITLIPKRSDAEVVGDFRPISLVHRKLFSKLLANRLRPKMEGLVSANQSAFIKGRNLHDDFILVRQMARRIHVRKETGVLLKLDISRAFDSLSWAFLFEVLRRLGFPRVLAMLDLDQLAICQYQGLGKWAAGLENCSRKRAASGRSPLPTNLCAHDGSGHWHVQMCSGAGFAGTYRSMHPSTAVVDLC
jgi:hypothetical protein